VVIAEEEQVKSPWRGEPIGFELIE